MALLWPRVHHRLWLLCLFQHRGTQLNSFSSLEPPAFPCLLNWVYSGKLYPSSRSVFFPFSLCDWKPSCKILWERFSASPEDLTSQHWLFKIQTAPDFWTSPSYSSSLSSLPPLQQRISGCVTPHYIPSSALSFHLTPFFKLLQNPGTTPKPPPSVSHPTASFSTPEVHPLGSSHSLALSSTHQSGLQACSWTSPLLSSRTPFLSSLLGSCFSSPTPQAAFPHYMQQLTPTLLFFQPFLASLFLFLVGEEWWLYALIIFFMPFLLPTSVCAALILRNSWLLVMAKTHFSTSELLSPHERQGKRIPAACTKWPWWPPAPWHLIDALCSSSSPHHHLLSTPMHCLGSAPAP